MDQGTEEDFAQFDSVATRKLLCAWSDRAALISALNPQGTAIGGVMLLNSVPYADFPSLYPQRFSTKGVGKMSVGPSGIVAYQHALVTAEYRPFCGGDPQGYVEFDMGTDVITMPTSGPWLETVDEFPYSSSNSDGVTGGTRRMDVPTVDCSRGYQMPIICIVRGRSNVPTLDVAAFSQMARNPLNSTSFLGFEPGTVMFEGARARKQTLSNVGAGVGSVDSPLSGPFEIECRFKARPLMAWDKVPFRMQSNGKNTFVVEQVQLKNGLGPYLGRSDLNQLFK